MATNIAKRLIELSYEWDPENNTHKLTWDTDYPINLTGVFTKIFKAGHTYTAGDRITLNGEEYTFTSLSGDIPRSKIFKADQYVPIAIDLDEKIIAYYSMAGGSGGGGSGSVISATIPISAWDENREYFIEISDIHEESTVVLTIDNTATAEEVNAIYASNISATQSLNGVTLKYQNKPTMDYHIQINLL